MRVILVLAFVTTASWSACAEVNADENDAITKLQKEIETLKEVVQNLNVLIDDKTEVNSQKIQRTNRLLENFRGPKIDKPMDTFSGPSEAYNLSSDTLVYTYTIKNYQPNSVYHKSPIFAISDYNLLAQVSENPKLSFSLRFLTEDNKAIKLPKTLPRVIYRVKDQTGSVDRKDKLRSRGYLFGSSFNKFTNQWYERVLFFGKHYSNLISDLISAPYLYDGSVVVEVHVERSEVAMRGYSYDGILNGSIERFERIQKWFQLGLIDSLSGSYFYTGPKGYRVGVWFNMTTNPWLTAHIDFLTGDNDADLSKSLISKLSLTIVNQKNASENIYRFRKSCKLNETFEIDKPADIDSFVVDDTLHYQVIVEVF